MTPFALRVAAIAVVLVACGGIVLASAPQWTLRNGTEPGGFPAQAVPDDVFVVPDEAPAPPEEVLLARMTFRTGEGTSMRMPAVAHRLSDANLSLDEAERTLRVTGEVKGLAHVGGVIHVTLHDATGGTEAAYYVVPARVGFDVLTSGGERSDAFHLLFRPTHLREEFWGMPECEAVDQEGVRSGGRLTTSASVGGRLTRVELTGREIGGTESPSCPRLVVEVTSLEVLRVEPLTRA